MADMYLGNESGGFDLVGTTNIKNIDFEEVKISKEDYENLSEEEQKSGVYLVTGLDDTEDGGGRADLISYDNTNSGLGSTNVQGAIDELNSNLGKLSVWNEIENFSCTSSGNWVTVGTFKEIINKFMIIFSTTTGDEQVIVYNLGDGSVCHGSYSWTLADSGATYDATREFKVNFNTGEITHRQKKGNNSTWSTYTVARYL